MGDIRHDKRSRRLSRSRPRAGRPCGLPPSAAASSTPSMKSAISLVSRSGARAQLDDRAGLEQAAALGSSSASMPASENGWTGSRRWPITSVGVAIVRRSLRCGAMRPKNSPCSTAAPGAGPGARGRRGCRPPTAAAGRRAPAWTARISGSPKLSAIISGVNASAQASSAPSSTGISITMPRRRSGARRGGLERGVRAQRGAEHDRLLDLEVVEQRDHLLAEEAHRVAPQVERALGLPVAEQVERDHAVAALRERPRQRLVHALAEQEPVQEHDDSGTLSVLAVRQRSPFVAGTSSSVRLPTFLRGPRFLSTAIMPYRWGVPRRRAQSPALGPGGLLRLASDERLVELVRGGEAAFEAVYDRHHRGILAFCRHMLSSPEEAEDAVQHTFMAAYRHLAGGDAEIQLRPWLYTIARNRCLSCCAPAASARSTSSRAGHRVPVRRGPAAPGRARGARRRRRAARGPARRARARRDRRVSHDEIAMVLGVPRQKVKALVFQARTSLIASRTARETPCDEIRAQLANLRGGALRRTTLHRHLRECPGCRAFREGRAAAQDAGGRAAGHPDAGAQGGRAGSGVRLRRRGGARRPRGGGAAGGEGVVRRARRRRGDGGAEDAPRGAAAPALVERRRPLPARPAQGAGTSSSRRRPRRPAAPRARPPPRRGAAEQPPARPAPARASAARGRRSGHPQRPSAPGREQARAASGRAGRRPAGSRGQPPAATPRALRQHDAGPGRSADRQGRSRPTRTPASAPAPPPPTPRPAGPGADRCRTPPPGAPTSPRAPGHPRPRRGARSRAGRRRRRRPPLGRAPARAARAARVRLPAVATPPCARGRRRGPRALGGHVRRPRRGGCTSRRRRRRHRAGADPHPAAVRDRSRRRVGGRGGRPPGRRRAGARPRGRLGPVAAGRAARLPVAGHRPGAARALARVRRRRRARRDHPRLARLARAARLRPRRLRGPSELLRAPAARGHRGAGLRARGRRARHPAHRGGRPRGPRRRPRRDIAALLRAGRRLFVLPERGYARLGATGSSCSPRSTRRPPATCCSRSSPRRPTPRSTSSGSPPRSSGRCPSCSTPGCGSSPAARCSCAATWGRSRPTSRAAPTCRRYGFRTVASRGGTFAMAKQPRSLAGKVAVVTGGGRGIGKAIARSLTREGVRVAIGDLDAAAAEQAAAEIGGGADRPRARRHRPPGLHRRPRRGRAAPRPDRRARQQRRDHADRPVRGGGRTRPRSASSRSTSTPSSTAPRRRSGG